MEYLQWVKEGEDTALRPNKYTKKGYLFTGWNTKRDGKGDHYDDKASIEAHDKVILYAQWTIVDLATLDDNTRWDQSIGKVFSLSKDVTISDRVEVTGDVTLILPEGMTLTASCGITVTEGNSLTIEGSGKLNATGLLYHAGIGGCEEENCGDITIKGGIINVSGGCGAAGIGGGIAGSGGNVTITGGSVLAVADQSDLDPSVIGTGIGRGLAYEGQELSDGNLTVSNVTLSHSDDGTNYINYEGTDYSTRYRCMKAE